MTAFEYISTKVYTILKPSNIAGIGVFSIKEIPIGINPFEVWNGKTGIYTITKEEFDTLSKGLQSHIRDIFLYSTDYPYDTDIHITLQKNCHWIYTTPRYFINSSIDKYNISKDDGYSTRKIRVGEELLSNYKRYERIDKKKLI